MNAADICENNFWATFSLLPSANWRPVLQNFKERDNPLVTVRARTKVAKHATDCVQQYLFSKLTGHRVLYSFLPIRTHPLGAATFRLAYLLGTTIIMHACVRLHLHQRGALFHTEFASWQTNGCWQSSQGISCANNTRDESVPFCTSCPAAVASAFERANN